MYPHRIRLRGPWECEPVAGTSQPAERLRFHRRFGYPGRIDAYERVWLTFTGIGGPAEIRLNGTSQGWRERTQEPFEFDITAILKGPNELCVEIEESSGGLGGEVALEVRCTAYLKDVQIRPEKSGPKTRLEVTGVLVGTCERPLELYVLVGNATVAY